MSGMGSSGGSPWWGIVYPASPPATPAGARSRRPWTYAPGRSAHCARRPTTPPAAPAYRAPMAWTSPPAPRWASASRHRGVPGRRLVRRRDNQPDRRRRRPRPRARPARPAGAGRRDRWPLVAAVVVAVAAAISTSPSATPTADLPQRRGGAVLRRPGGPPAGAVGPGRCRLRRVRRGLRRRPARRRRPGPLTLAARRRLADRGAGGGGDRAGPRGQLAERARAEAEERQRRAGEQRLRSPRSCTTCSPTTSR